MRVKREGGKQREKHVDREKKGERVITRWRGKMRC
jgi:hypothetical protein